MAGGRTKTSCCSNVRPSGVICSSSRTAPLKRATHAGKDGSVPGRRWSGSLIGSMVVNSVPISSSAKFDRSLGPVAPSSVPVLRDTPLFERVILEFFDFVFGPVIAAEQRDALGPALGVRAPAIGNL